jgi:hypothetical protein
MSTGWTDPRSVFGTPGKIVYVHQKEPMTMWTYVLPKRMQKYKITCNGNLIGDQLTEEEADALLAILNSDLKVSDE